MTSMKEIERMTLKEYAWRIEAYRVREFEKLYKMHQQAFINQIAKSTEQKGNKIEPKYKTFDEFFNYEKKRREILGDLYNEKQSKNERLKQLILQANSQ